MIKSLINKIYTSIFGYSFRRNIVRRFLNSLQPNFVKSFFAKYYWSKNDFKNKGNVKTIDIYDNEEARNSLDQKKLTIKTEVDHKEKSNRIFNQIKSNTTEIKKVLEFGSNYGVNLENFLKNEQLEVVGIDLNKVVKNLEKKYSNYKGIIGDQKSLLKFQDLHFDVVFTSSVLDHFPDESEVVETIKQLKRISKVVFLFEPYVEGVSGDVSYYHRFQVEQKFNLKKPLENNYIKFGRNSFFWDYDKHLHNLNYNFSKTSFPLHLSSLGPFYFAYHIK